MTVSKLTGSAGVLIVQDVQKAADYWRDAVGFGYERMHGEPPNFCIVRRDGFSIMLAQIDDPARAPAPYWRVLPGLWNAYFWVDDAEALYSELQQRGATIDYTLGVKNYDGVRVKEFGIQDLDNHDIGFCEVL